MESADNIGGYNVSWMNGTIGMNMRGINLNVNNPETLMIRGLIV